MSCCNAVLVAFLLEVPPVSLALRQSVAVCQSFLVPSHQSTVGRQSRMRPMEPPCSAAAVCGRTPASRAAYLYLAAGWCASAFTRKIRVPSTVPHKATPALDKMTSFAEWSEAVDLNPWHFYVCVWVTGGRGSSHVHAYRCKRWRVKRTKPKLNPLWDY